jgi:hypothetical protein
MKKIIFLISIFSMNSFCFSQTPKDPVSYLVNNDDFINWVSNVTNNEWEIQVDFKKQLGDNIGGFRKSLSLTQTHEDVNNVIAEYGLDPEFSDQKMAEHLVFGIYLKQQNPWLWALAETERTEIVRQSYFQGMSSNDPRWISIKSNLLNLVQTHCGSTGRISASEIAECFWEAAKEAFAIVGGIAAVVGAVNAGNWSAMIGAIKKVLKTAARRLGWFGLAVAAIDIGICIWNAND